MSANKGKKYEREVCTRLRDQGFKAERIRGSGGGTGTRSADILFIRNAHWPNVPHAHETRGEDKQGLTIERAVESGRIDTDFVFDGEVKYSSDGFSRVYTEQWRRGKRAVCPWQDGVLSCGLGAFDKPSELVSEQVWKVIKMKDWFGKQDGLPSLTNSTESIMQGEGTAKAPDFVFVRRSKNSLGPVDWVVLWEVNGE